MLSRILDVVADCFHLPATHPMRSKVKARVKASTAALRTSRTFINFDRRISKALDTLEAARAHKMEELSKLSAALTRIQVEVKSSATTTTASVVPVHKSRRITHAYAASRNRH